VPVQVIIGERHFASGNVELKIRRTGERKIVPQVSVIEEVKSTLAGLASLSEGEA